MKHCWWFIYQSDTLNGNKFTRVGNETDGGLVGSVAFAVSFVVAKFITKQALNAEVGKCQSNNKKDLMLQKKLVKLL